MIIDIAIPTYRTPHPIAWNAIQNMGEHSRCKCWQDSLRQLSEKARKPAAIHQPKDCPRGKHDIHVAPSINSSILHWGRNAMVQSCRKEADYILLCDDDMVPDPDHLDRLLAHRVDIVAGIATKRIDPPMPNARRWVEQTQNYGEILAWGEKVHMLEVDAVGTGFMLVSRRAIEEIAEAYHPDDYKATGNGWWFEYIRAPRGGEWGEDISFCWKAKRVGLKIHCDLTVNPGHIGDYVYRLDDYLAYQSEVVGAAQQKAQSAESALQLVTK